MSNTLRGLEFPTCRGPRHPKGNGRLAWCRAIHQGGGIAEWRLYRRSSVDRRVHLERVVARGGMTRAQCATRLRAARLELRDRVDAYDLSLMGLAS